MKHLKSIYLSSFLIFTQFIAYLAIPIPESHDIKVSIGSSNENIEKHPIFTKMLLYSNGEIAFSPRNEEGPELTMRPERVSNITTYIKDKKDTNSQWYYISVKTIEGIIYHIASQDEASISNIKSKIHSFAEVQSKPIDIISSLLGVDGSGTSVSDIAVNIASNILRNTDIKQIEALAAQKIIQCIL